MSVIIGKTEQTDFEFIYTPLTIVKKVEIEKEMKDKTSLNEISLLRKMMKNETYLKKIDFDEYLSKINSNSHEFLCLIGHPGSGKTFLTSYTGPIGLTTSSLPYKYPVVAIVGTKWKPPRKRKRGNSTPISYRTGCYWECHSAQPGPKLYQNFS